MTAQRTHKTRTLAVAAAFAAAMLVSVHGTSGCSGEDENCAGEQENCSRAYLDANGLTGCCEGLTCQDSPVTPGARVCR